MTHGAVGLYTDNQGNIWCTIHMVERAIVFTNFVLKVSAGVVSKKSIIIEGDTPYEIVRIGMMYEDASGEDSLTKTLIPEPDGNFTVDFDFGHRNGKYTFVFSVLSAGRFKVCNRFLINIQ